MSTDRNEARAEAAAAKARAKSLRPWWRRKRVIIPVALVFLLIVAASLETDDEPETVSSDDGVESVQASGSNAAEDDVEITSCEAGSVGWEAEVKITNHSSKRSNYLVELTLTDPNGTKVGDMIASSNNVDPGQVALEQAFGSGDGDGLTCKVASVTRYAS